MGEQKRTFPMLPIAHWWALRKKFKQSIPGVVTDNYLATVLDMEVNSARANVLPFLKTLGIIDAEGKTLERAKQWRDDGHYVEVCQAMVRDVYPKDLLEAVPRPDEERGQAERWFANHTGAGEAAVKRMVALYSVLVEADPSKQPDAEKTRARRAEKDQTKVKSVGEAEAVKDSRSPATGSRSSGPSHIERSPQPPGININLEIHISADATPDQIDQIFASMAKHIYRG
ncbi:MAG: DUF5343 domain-containing protein [Blastocatellia bacterium]